MRAGSLMVEREIESQPEMWRRAASLAEEALDVLPRAGSRFALIGCGTSYFVAHAIACLRQSRDLGETDAFVASEFPADRRYGAVAAITRSGTTTEVIHALASVLPDTRRIALCATPDAPVAEEADDTLTMA